MKKIAIFVSGSGEAAERLIKLFNEGNRVKTVVLVADDSAQPVLDRISDPEVTLLHYPDAEWHSKGEEISEILRSKGVDLLVLDEFGLALPDEILESTNGEMIRVSSAQQAPREVVAALEADLHKPVEEVKEEVQEEGEKSQEREWADALKINYTPPKIPTTPPEVPLEKEGGTRENEEGKPWMDNGYYKTETFQKEGQTPHQEPMPSTWLIWSILVTVFCCFIPGIIAIIFSSQVPTRYYSGDIEAARRASRNAEIWIIVSFVLGVITATLYLPFMILGS